MKRAVKTKWPTLRKDTCSKALREEEAYQNNDQVTVSVRVKKAKYSQAIVLPFWSYSQLLHCCSGLQLKAEESAMAALLYTFIKLGNDKKYICNIFSHEMSYSQNN